jgi:hypothetical protein
MDAVSIVNGNVWGHFRDVLKRKVRFLQVHNSASLVAKRIPYSSRLDIIERETNKSLATGTNFDFWLNCHVRSNRTSCMHVKNQNNKNGPKNRTLYAL